MGKSPYLRTWYSFPSLSLDNSTFSCNQPTEPLIHDEPTEAAPLRNPYLSRGRQMGCRKKRGGSPSQPVATEEKEESKPTVLSVKSEKGGEASRLYLRSWYPA